MPWHRWACVAVAARGSPRSSPLMATHPENGVVLPRTGTSNRTVAESTGCLRRRCCDKCPLHPISSTSPRSSQRPLPSPSSVGSNVEARLQRRRERSRGQPACRGSGALDALWDDVHDDAPLALRHRLAVGVGGDVPGPARRRLRICSCRPMRSCSRLTSMQPIAPPCSIGHGCVALQEE